MSRGKGVERDQRAERMNRADPVYVIPATESSVNAMSDPDTEDHAALPCVRSGSTGKLPVAVSAALRIPTTRSTARSCLIGVACFIAVVSCQSSVTDAVDSDRLIALTADDQVLDVGQSTTLSLRVLDARDRPRSGVEVLWTVDGSGSIEPVSVTNADGVASASMIVGRGENRVMARTQAGDGRTVFLMHGCLRCGEWTQLPLSYGGRAWSSAPVVDGGILIVGGFDQQVSTRAIDIFEPGKPGITHAAELPFAIGGSTTAVMNGRVFVIGGFSDEYIAHGLPTVFAFEPSTGQWSEKAPLETGRFLASGAVLNGRIHVVGGRTVCDYDGYCPGPLADLDIYDPLTDSWTHGPRMNEARALAGAAVLDGRLYVAGGTSGEDWWYDLRAGLSSVEMYDPSTNTWSRRAPLPDAGPVQLAASNGSLYAFVSNEQRVYSHVYEYDSEMDAWTRLRNAPASLIGPAVAAEDGRLYVFGGYDFDPADPYRRDISQSVYVLAR